MDQEIVPLKLVTDWSDLPVEILICVFRCLDMRALSCAMRVCFRWASAARIELLWFHVLKRDVWLDLKRGSNRSFFDMARKSAVVDENWSKGRFQKSRLAQREKGVIDFLVLGEHVVTCGLERSLWVSDGGGGMHTQELKGHSHYVVSLRELSNGFAASSYDGTVSLWDGRDFRRVGVLAGHTAGVLDTRKVPSSQWLVSRSRDGNSRLWDLERCACVGVLRGHTQSVTGLKVIDPNSVISCSRDGTVCLFDLRDKKVVRRADDPLHSCDVYALHLPKWSKGTVVASCGADSKIVLWDFAENKVVKSAEAAEVPYCMQSSAECPNVLYSGGGSGSLLVWEEGEEVRRVQQHHTAAINCLKLVGSNIVSGSLDKGVAIWSAPQQKLQFSFPSHHKDVVRRVKADHLGFQTCGYDGQVLDCDFSSGAPPKSNVCVLQ